MKTIKLKLVERCSSKLQFVKTIKECSNLGLKEAKDVCDRLHDGQIQVFEVRSDGTIDYYKKFISDIPLSGGKLLISGGIEFQREYKMLELGIGSNEDYSEFILEYLEHNFENQKEFLKFAFSKLNREQLVSIFEKAKETYKDYID